jgi:hypothetical protein
MSDRVDIYNCSFNMALINIKHSKGKEEGISLLLEQSRSILDAVNYC